MINRLIFLILIFCSSCNKNHDNHNINNNNNNVKIIKTNNLKNMLKRHSLKKEMFNDSVFNYDYYLWIKYFRNSKVLNSSSLGYPSTDSSFTLITNYNKRLNKTVLKNAISFSFLEDNTNFFYVGYVYSDSLQNIKFDFCWKDGETFYLLEEKKKDFYLTKITMKNDTIWNYIIKDK